jgi:hypothetical protein
MIVVLSLPKLRSETKSQLALCETRLAAMPPKIAEPFAFVLELIQSFSLSIRQHVQGDIDATALVQNCRLVYQELKANIRKTAPLFVPLNELPPFGLPSELKEMEESEADSVVTTLKAVTITDVKRKISRYVRCRTCDAFVLIFCKCDHPRVTQQRTL